MDNIFAVFKQNILSTLQVIKKANDEINRVVQEPPATILIRTFVDMHWNPSLYVDIYDPKDGIKLLFLTEDDGRPIDASQLACILSKYFGTNDLSSIAIYILTCIARCVNKINFKLDAYLGKRFDERTMLEIHFDLIRLIEQYDNTHDISLKDSFFNELVDINLFNTLNKIKEE